MAATIDTLRLAKRFKDVQLPDDQAELFAEVFREAQEAGAAQLATKADLERTGLSLRADLEKTERVLRADLEKAERVLRADLEKTELSLRADVEKLELSIRRDLATLEAKIAEAKFDLLKWIVPLLAAQLLALVGLYFR